MKTLIVALAFISAISTTYAQDDAVRTYQVDHSKKGSAQPVRDSIKLQTDSSVAYYQKTFKLDSSITVSTIYLRSLQFMAAKNFQQNYGYEQEGKLIYTTTQDLHTAYTGDYDDFQPYAVQFAVTIDMKNARYRTTISNVTFYLPSENGNLRLSLKDMHQRELTGNSKQVRRTSKNIIDSFEKYLVGITGELYVEIEHKAAIFNSKF